MSSPPNHTRPSNHRARSRKSGRGSIALLIASGLLMTLAVFFLVYVVKYKPTLVVYPEPTQLLSYVPPTASSTSPRESGDKNSKSHIEPGVPRLNAESPVRKKSERNNEIHRGRRVRRNSRHHPPGTLPLESENRPRLGTVALSRVASPTTTAPTPIGLTAANPQAKKPCVRENTKPGFFKRALDGILRFLKLKKKKEPEPLNSRPVVKSFEPSLSIILRPCAADTHPSSGRCSATGESVILTTVASDPDEDQLTYSYTVTGGRIIGEGNKTVWNLSGMDRGTYTATVTVEDGCRFQVEKSTTVTIENCADCVPDLVCPTIKVNCPDSVIEGKPATFTADVPTVTPSISGLNWTVSGGTITSGQGTSSMRVDTTGKGGSTITATLEISGLDPSCNRTASCSMAITTISRTISGSVFGPDGRRVPGLSVRVIGPRGDVPVRLDNNGNFSATVSDFSAIYQIVLSAPGLKTNVIRWDPIRGPARLLPIRMEAASGPSPQPTSTPGASPEASGSPETTPTPTPTRADKSQSEDQIKASYPSYLQTDNLNRVTFELDRVIGAVIPHQTNIDGKIELIDKPPPDPSATPNIPFEYSRGDQYTAFATVNLIESGVTIFAGQDGVKKSLEPNSVNWVWDVQTEEGARQASIQFKVDVVWLEKSTGRPHPKSFSFVWPHDSRHIPIGPPLHVTTMAYGSPVLFAGSFATLFFGLSGLKKRLGLVQNENEADEVSATLFSPLNASPGDGFLVQVFAHLADQKGEIVSLATAADPDAVFRGYAFKKKLERGTELGFLLTMPGLRIDERLQKIPWEGVPAKVQFGVKVPRGFALSTVVGSVTVCVNGVPVGPIRFRMRIVANTSNEPISSAVPVELQRYKQAFISYSRKDRKEVFKRVQMLDLIRLDYFVDLMKLKPADKWKPKIYAAIEKSDVVFLFWSKRASESVWVRDEILHAMNRKAGSEEAPPDILPVIIEGPPPAPPPQELSDLNFDDPISYFFR